MINLTGLFAGMVFGIFITNTWITLHFIRLARESKEELLKVKEDYNVR